MDFNMSALTALAVFSTVCCVGLSGYVLGMARRMKELEELCDRRDEVIRAALANLAKDAGIFADKVRELDEKLAFLDGKLEELPLDELTEEYKSLKSWNDGVQNILNFGPDVPKLNKEVLKHE